MKGAKVAVAMKIKARPVKGEAETSRRWGATRVLT